MQLKVVSATKTEQSLQDTAAAVGLKPGCASCCGEKSTHCAESPASTTPTKPTAGEGMGSVIRSGYSSQLNGISNKFNFPLAGKGSIGRIRRRIQAK